MNILALVTEAYGGSGGIAQYNRDLIGVLAEANFVHEIRVLPRLASTPVKGMPDKVKQAAACFGRVPFALRTWREAVRRRPDLLFCGHLYMVPLAHFVARALGVPYVAQLHGLEIWRKPSRVQIRALEKAEMIFCVSRHTRAQVLKFSTTNPNRVVVVPNTFAPSYRPRDRRTARASLGLADAFALLTIGRLDSREQYKGHDRVISALPNLRKDGCPILYLIAGDGDDRPRLEALAANLGVEKQVHFLGFWPRESLPDLYAAADLFVMPSTGEGFGIVFLEAMASGTPALGLACGGSIDPLDFGAWGRAVPEAEFEAALVQAISMPRPEPAMMQAAVIERFGRKTFAREALGDFARLDRNAQLTELEWQTD